MAIILKKGRPALPVENGTFGPFPPPLDKPFEPQRALFEAAARQVGLLVVEGHPYIVEAGTCFLVAPDLVMTASFVTQLFASVHGPLDVALKEGITVRVRFPGLSEVESPTVSAVAFVHPAHSCAALRLDWGNSQEVGKRVGSGLRLAERAPESLLDMDVAVIGYCFEDSRNDTLVQKEIFAAGYGKLYLTPGRSRGLGPYRDNGTSSLRHDCSTLGGSSGAPVVEGQTGAVLGIHFAGMYLETNHAVPSWSLAADRPVRDAGVTFTNDPPWAHLWRGPAKGEPRSVGPSPVSAPAPAPQGPLLRGDELQDIHALLISTNLVDPGTFRALFVGIDTAVVALLSVEGPPTVRALTVLDSLNQMEQVQDGTWPVYLFLRNAANLTQGLKQGQRLREIVHRLQKIVDPQKAPKKVSVEP